MQTEQLLFAIIVGYFLIGCAILGAILEDDHKTPQEAHAFLVLAWPAIVIIFLAVLCAAFETWIANHVRSNKEVN